MRASDLQVGKYYLMRQRDIYSKYRRDNPRILFRKILGIHGTRVKWRQYCLNQYIPPLNGCCGIEFFSHSCSMRLAKETELAAIHGKYALDDQRQEQPEYAAEELPDDILLAELSRRLSLKPGCGRPAKLSRRLGRGASDP